MPAPELVGLTDLGYQIPAVLGRKAYGCIITSPTHPQAHAGISARHAVKLLGAGLADAPWIRTAHAPRRTGLTAHMGAAAHSSGLSAPYSAHVGGGTPHGPRAAHGTDRDHGNTLVLTNVKRNLTFSAFSF